MLGIMGKLKAGKLASFIIVAMSLVGCAGVSGSFMEVAIKTTPHGASVFVNDIQKDTTPCAIHLEPGSHAIQIKKEGFLSVLKTVIVRWTEDEEGRKILTSNYETGIDLNLDKSDVPISDNEDF